MKRTRLIPLLVLPVLIGLAGCGPGNRAAENRDRLNVTVTIFPPYDFTREIAGDLVNLTMLLPPGSESHSYEPSPRDIITLQNSDVFIYVGGESDEWVRDILASMDTSKMKILALMDCVSPVEEEIVEGMEDEDDALAALGIEVEAEYDEHVWTSPQNAALIVGAITRTLTGADPAHGEDYQRKSSAYIEELASLDAAFRAVVDGAARKTIIFGDRFPFRYFADAYGLSYFAAFPGCSTETEPSAATVAFLIDKIRAEKIPVVFYIELSNERMADTISEATGAEKLLLHACHNLSKDDFARGISYLELMKNNVENLKAALW